MDIKHPRRPRQGSFVGMRPQPISQQASGSLTANISMPMASQLPSYLRQEGGSYDMPSDVPVESAKKIVGQDDLAKPSINYAVNASAHKKFVASKAIYNVLFTVTILLLFITASLGGLGVYLNAKYVGKALPFAKIGNVSVGGMDREQIKALLGSTSQNLTITFVDGGLSWEVPATSFNPEYDFDTAIDQTIAKRFNPYSFLLKTQVPVSATANERQVSGYLRQNITHMQTRSEDAYIMKGTDSVIAKPEVLGFSANPAHVTDQINSALSLMTDVTIKMNSVGVRPNIYTADLQAEINRANTLLDTPVSVKYAGTSVSPSKKQKLEWLQINQIAGSAYYTYDFSKPKIREFVVGLAQKYQRPVKVEQPGNSENPSGYSVPTVVINNVESVTDQIYDALKNNRSTVAFFTKDNTVNRVIPVTQVAGASTKTPSASVPTTSSVQASSQTQKPASQQPEQAQN